MTPDKLNLTLVHAPYEFLSLRDNGLSECWQHLPIFGISSCRRGKAHVREGDRAPFSTHTRFLLAHRQQWPQANPASLPEQGNKGDRPLPRERRCSYGDEGLPDE